MLSCDFHEKPDVAILIKGSYFDETKLNRYYVQPLSKLGVNQLMAIELVYPEKGKLSVAIARKNILKLLPALANHGIKYLYVADATYFKALTGQNKADTHLGYVLPCKLKDYEHMQVIFGINYGQLLYTLNASTKLDLTLQTLAEHYQGNYVTRGDIIKTALYPTNDEIDDVLIRLKQYPALACDIETTGLELGSELYSIAFAWSQHEGCAFKVTDKVQLKRFFESYSGVLIFHNATFDIKHIIYHCFMDNPRDFKGMIHGLHTMCRNIEDTKIIAYLATNNTQGNILGLKELSHEFVGNYAIDVKHVLNHPLATVLEYNLKDTLATYWVFNKYKPKMLSDNQDSIYKTIMLPSIKTIIQIELHGMPMNMDKVVVVKKQLQNQANDALEQIYASEHVKAVTHELQTKELEKINSKLKTKQHTLDKVKDLQFKPNSTAHLAILLYDYLGLPILDYTPNKQPAVGAGTKNSAGYRVISLFGKRYPEHRLAWFYVHGEMPKHEIDHINQIRDDNRISNLRQVTRSENQRNKTRKDSRVDEIGIWWCRRRKRYIAEISLNGKKVYQKSFTDIDEAISARKAKALELGFHENHGKTQAQY